MWKKRESEGLRRKKEEKSPVCARRRQTHTHEEGPQWGGTVLRGSESKRERQDSWKSQIHVYQIARPKQQQDPVYHLSHDFSHLQKRLL